MKSGSLDLSLEGEARELAQTALGSCKRSIPGRLVANFVSGYCLTNSIRNCGRQLTVPLSDHLSEFVSLIGNFVHTKEKRRYLGKLTEVVL